MYIQIIECLHDLNKCYLSKVILYLNLNNLLIINNIDIYFMDLLHITIKFEKIVVIVYMNLINYWLYAYNNDKNGLIS